MNRSTRRHTAGRHTAAGHFGALLIAIPAIVILLFLGGVPELGFAQEVGFVQEVPDLGGGDPIPTPHGIQVGGKECAACHTQPGILYPKLGVTQFVRLTEAAQWFEYDKHAVAYELVRIDLPDHAWEAPKHASNLHSRSIVERLGWVKGDGNFERKCLTCHVGLGLDQDIRSPRIVDNLPFGVQCESCHGPGSQYMQTENHQQPTWRTKSSEEKERLGMNDLSNPARCAEVCLSCHLGDIDQGRFVSHAMFAAGHPALPPFELQTFLDAMPPHWSPLNKKPLLDGAHEASDEFQNQRLHYLARLDLPPESSTRELKRLFAQSYERTKRSQIGAMVASDAGLRMIQEAAERQELWGDYALYDCMGCHQTLTKDKPRYRPLGRIPGRAFPPQWVSLRTPSPVSDSGPVSESTEDAYAMLLSRMEAAFNRIPFGDSGQIREVARTSRELLDTHSREHRAMGRGLLDVESVRDWLQELINERREKLTDYWVARQTAWLVSIAIEELIEKGELDRTPVASELAELEQHLQLRLRVPQRQSVLDNQGMVLEAANSFDAQRCAELMVKIVREAAP